MYSNLFYEGQVFKNYRDMCRKLDIPIKTGEAKSNQLEDINRYALVQKEDTGNKFHVLEVYDEPIEKEENMRNTPEYIKYTEILLMQLLLKQENNRLLISNSQMGVELSLLHQDYKSFYASRIKLSEMLNVDIKVVDDFISCTNTSYKRAVDTTIRRLENQMAIIHKYLVAIKIKEYDEDTEKTETVYRVADYWEEDEILRIKNEVLVLPEFYGDMVKVRINKKMDKYYEAVNERLYNELGIIRAYKAHQIVINHNAVEREFIKSMKSFKLLTYDEVKELRENVKLHFSNKMLINAENRNRRALLLTESNLNVEEKYKTRSDGKYVNGSERLINAILKDGVNKTYHSTTQKLSGKEDI